MKKLVSILLLCALALTSISALAAPKPLKPNKFSLPLEGTVLQNVPDRGIIPQTDAARRPMVPGESPTTGLPWDGSYLPMIVQISNSSDNAKALAENGKNIVSSGLGAKAPWGGQYADIVFEGSLRYDGATRISFLFSDSFADGQPVSAGPVRSARIGHVLLRQEWQSGIVYAGGPRRTDNNIRELFGELGADDAGVLFDLTGGHFNEYQRRLKKSATLLAPPKAPDNLDSNVIGLRGEIPSDYHSEPRAFLFTDESPYVEGYEFGYTINLDWGDKRSVSHFRYDEDNNLYLRFCGETTDPQKWAPYMTYASGEDRSAENQEQLSFANVIIQRVEYEYVNNNKIMPNMQSVGQGNADIFIGGRYIPGYWVRKGVDDPTVFYDDKGEELQLTRGKTFIVHFPPESLCTFTGVE